MLHVYSEGYEEVISTVAAAGFHSHVSSETDRQKAEKRNEGPAEWRFVVLFSEFLYCLKDRDTEPGQYEDP